MPEAATLDNSVLRNFRAGKPAFGMSVRMSRSADIARIARASGHDFIFIDSQQAIFDIETTAHIAQTALAIGIAPVVRVRGIDDPDGALLLDNGVSGIVFPDISTVAQAKRAVEIVRFPPLRKRSVSGGYVQFDFRARPVGAAAGHGEASCHGGSRPRTCTSARFSASSRSASAVKAARSA